MTFELPDLPYAHDALEPYVSADTLNHHHGKHHAAYVNKLNQLVSGSDLAERTLEEIIVETVGVPENKAIFNNAAQAWNHAFYWRCLSPSGGGAPNGELGSRIVEEFSSFDNFRTEFQSVASGHFGSGWAWLVHDGNRLQITATSDAMTPIATGQHPLLTCDVWEHAYYLDYQNRRPDYVAMFLEKLVNWDFVAQRLAKAETPAVAA